MRTFFSKGTEVQNSPLIETSNRPNEGTWNQGFLINFSSKFVLRLVLAFAIIFSLPFGEGWGGVYAQLNLGACACPADLPAGAGSFSGKTCFDIALSNDNTNGCAPLINRVSDKADFTLPATNTQVYTYTPAASVSKVRFAYEDLNGLAIQSMTPNNPGYKTALNIGTACTVTVVYKNNLNTTALGKTAATAIKPKLFIIYNNNGNGLGTDVKLELTPQIKDCICTCGAPTNTGGWLDFLCHNLGANTNLDPFTYQGGAINGGQYLWGGPNWGNYWSVGSKSPTDPCPAGYRVPDITQWESIYNGVSSNWVWTGNGYMVGANLYLPATGGTQFDPPAGSAGVYWSTKFVPDGGSGSAQGLAFTAGAMNIGGTNYSLSGQGYRLSVRCVKQ